MHDRFTMKHNDGTHEQRCTRLRGLVAVTTICILGLPGRSSCAESQAVAESATEVAPAVQAERDTIFTLMAYAVVYKDWQTELEYTRGHNIGSVLVHLPTGKVVHWARNCNKITVNGSNHGEVRLIRGFLQNVEDKMYLDDYCVYTTLEPCAMCSGMMCLTKVPRTVYGQTDPDYGKAVERLKLNSSASGGYKRYPRVFKSIRADTDFTKKLDKQYKQSGEESITSWLRSNDALIIYRDATKAFLNYKVEQEENKQVYRNALKFYGDVVPDQYAPLRYKERKPKRAGTKSKSRRR